MQITQIPPESSKVSFRLNTVFTKIANGDFPADHQIAFIMKTADGYTPEAADIRINVTIPATGKDGANTTILTGRATADALKSILDQPQILSVDCG